MKPKNSKQVSTITKPIKHMILVIAFMTIAPVAIAACYVVVSYLCKTAGSAPCSKDCVVHCLCPKDAVINGVCHKIFNMTCAWTDSTMHSLNCTGGDRYSSCTVDGAGLQNACSWSQQVIVCPPDLSPLVCVPTLSYQTRTGPRTTVITGYPCPSV